MTDYSKFKDYELNEEDIDKAIHILSVFDPDNATPEKAIDFLEWLRTEVHMAAHNSTPEELMELYKRFSGENNKGKKP